MIEKLPRHRPERKFSNIKRIVLECSLIECVHCGAELTLRRPRHMRKTVQTIDGAVFVAGKSKECTNSSCTHFGKHYYATGVIKYSLPYSTYGLDVLAFIGWQHEHEHQQLVEIQRSLKGRGVEINESNVGKLYRQFLALLGGTLAHTQEKLAATAIEHGGLIWAIDALQPEGHGTLLYVLYEVLSGTPVSGIQLPQAQAQRLIEWLQPYMSRNAELMAVESQIRAAVRDCVNRTSRKPFRWGGIEGYQQLKTIGAILRTLPCRKIDTDYLSLLSVWVDQALSNNLSVALDLEQAHQWLRRIADCLHYPKYFHPHQRQCD